MIVILSNIKIYQKQHKLSAIKLTIKESIFQQCQYKNISNGLGAVNFTFCKIKFILQQFSRTVTTTEIMQPNSVSSNFFTPLPSDMAYYPFYPYIYHNPAHFLFYGWKNDHYATNNSYINPECLTQTIDQAQDSKKKVLKPEKSRQSPQNKNVQDQYLHHFKSQRRQQRKSAAQSLENRNIIPNIACNILSFLRRINRSGKVVERIINQKKVNQEENYSVKKFYAYQHYLKENLTDFKGKDVVEVLISALNKDCKCFTISEQLFYNTVSRTLIKNYLENNFLVDILSSNRVSKSNRKDYMKGRKIMIDLLKGIAEYGPEVSFEN